MEQRQGRVRCATTFDAIEGGTPDGGAPQRALDGSGSTPNSKVLRAGPYGDAQRRPIPRLIAA
jgi:hypothetical protein